MRERIIAATQRSLDSIWHPRFYENERGYQGILYYFLLRNLQGERLLAVPGDRLLELEYQKSSRHGLGQRPDIVFHHPNEQHGEGVNRHNFAVWALKADANESLAMKDFNKLDEMFETLHYELGFFINMNSSRDYLEFYRGGHRDKLVGACAWLDADGAHCNIRMCDRL